MAMTARDRKKFEKALAEATSVFEGVDVASLRLPIESQTDLVREAVSVIAYFDMRESFTEETCRGCKLPFAYAYYTTSVKHCSIPCLKKTLEDYGFVWDPSKSYEERWGSRYIPAIVPATAYAIIQQQRTLEPETVPEPATTANNAIGAADLMAKLRSLGQ